MADSSPECIPVRLIICVDGTWFGPDGISSVWAGNVSNIFRIWCSIKDGEVNESAGKKWRQEKVYIKGIDNLSNWGLKLLSGAFGSGIEQQIKDVYRMCVEKASQPEDEIFFFGFSRGAFVVKAVANLLAYMRLPGPSYSEKSFDEVYEHILDLYKDVRLGNDSRKGAIHEYMVRCRPHPRIQFIGVLDTVKAMDDDGLYEFGLHTSHRHCRQALALNETNTLLAPELWLIKEGTADFELRRASRHHSLQELWFLGSHGDLGGGNKQDGLALYPCQWLLSEARNFGLHLDFTPVTYSTLSIGDKTTVDNPLQLCFPSEQSEVVKSGRQPITSANGMSVKMWDLATTHSRAGYNSQINQRKAFWSLSFASRQVFADDKLIGYIESGKYRQGRYEDLSMT
jgi:uncharacterized protein (DUF2235 family)